MARADTAEERDAEREMREAMRPEPFIRGGVNQLVQVLPVSANHAVYAAPSGNSVVSAYTRTIRLATGSSSINGMCA